MALKLISCAVLTALWGSVCLNFLAGLNSGDLE